MASHSCHSRQATANYISDMLKELRSMSQEIDADFLVYLLEMAAMEASDAANGKETPPRLVTPVPEKKSKPNADELARLYLAGAYD